MMKPKNPISESGTSVFDGMSRNMHWKFTKSNQDFKFLLVHPETSAKNVVISKDQIF